MATRSVARSCIERLRVELERLGVPADLHEGDGVALLWVGGDLVVWCEPGPQGWRFRWWTGRVSDRTGHYVYTECPAVAVKTAARRIIDRCAELLHSRSQSPWDAPLPCACTGGER